MGVGGAGACTLLGPEGPGAVFLRFAPGVRGVGGGLDSSGLHEAERLLGGVGVLAVC